MAKKSPPPDRAMHHARKSNHRKMLKPKFYSSSSDSDDDDDVDDASAPMKWKPIVASFPNESNVRTEQKRSIRSNPIIDSLDAKVAKQQQKLSAEVIQKEEIYNQAEVEANRKMFGCANPGRCLSKDEIKRRKDIILNIVNERLKSKLSELMGEFGERIEMNDTYGSADDTSRYRNQSPDDDDDDDDLPEAPPPPTFNTSSESSDDDLDLSMTKEFELYEKEIQEKISAVNSLQFQLESSSDVVTTSTTTSAAFTLSATYNSVQVCPANSIPNAQTHILQQTSTNYQQNWQQPVMHQWPTTDQSTDAPWIPPVGPPQVMDPFPPPIESEQMSFMVPPPNFQTFPKTVVIPPPANGWMHPNSGWTNPPPTTFPPSYGTIAPHFNPEWINKFRPPVRVQMNSFSGETGPNISKWNPRGPRPSSSYIRPYNEVAAVRPSTSVMPVRSELLTSANNVNVSIVSKSTYVNAILAAEQRVVASTASEMETQVELNQVNVERHESPENRLRHKESNSQKRTHDRKAVEDVGCENSNENPNEFPKRVRLDHSTSKVKKTRFDNPKQDQRQAEQEEKSQNSLELDARHEKTNAEALKFLSKFWRANTINTDDTTTHANGSINDQTNVPIEWSRLCDIVDKLLDLPPDSVQDLPATDRRVKERNEILLILSDDPGNFYAHVDKYGEHNVKWAVKMAQRILFPQGRYDDDIAMAIAPLQRAIHVANNKVSIPGKQGWMPKNTAKVFIPSAKTATVPNEWMKLCRIADKLLGIPTRIAESLPPSDSRIKERNDILMMLSNDPEDFLLQDGKYGAHNVDWAILAAKRILCPDGVCDERVRRIIMRQRDNLMRKSSSKSTGDRSISRDRESRKRSIQKSATNENRSLPKEWNQLCDIVDKLLDTPKEVRIKMSKRDPRWELRENILLLLTDDPDKLAAQAEELGPDNVEWAIKSSKRIMFPGGSKDRNIFKKLSPQRRLLLRNRQGEGLDDNRIGKEIKTTKQVKTSIEKTTDQRNDVNGVARKVVDEKPTKKDKPPVDKIKITTHQESEGNKCSVVEKTTAKDHRPTKESQSRSKDDQKAPSKSEKEISVPVVVATADKKIDENEVWAKLCSIVDKLLDLPPNAAAALKSSDKRLIERNDVLMILSDDPENFSKFDVNYGSTNVVWAIKSAKKLIYSNGKPNAKLTDALWKQRDAIMCSEESPKDPKEESKEPTPNECNEWNSIRKIATKVFLLSCKTIANKKNLTKDQLHQQIELLLQLSDDPDVVRSKPICKVIGEGRVEAAIAKCKHILNRMRKSNEKALLDFENLRFKMVLYCESLNQSKNIKNYDVILAEVRKIVDQRLFNEIHGQQLNKRSKEQLLERNELAILLIKDPQFLTSSAKYSELVRKAENASVTEIIAEVGKCLQKCEYVKEKPVEICAPIIAKIKDVRYMSPFKERKLTQRIHRLIEQFLIAPKPEVFEVRFDDGTVDVVCANAMTFDWLKNSIHELDGLWPNAQLNISKAPITWKVLDDGDLKEIKMMFKTVPAEKFPEMMEQMKKSNAKLNTERWKSVPSKFPDAKKTMFVLVDLESLVELERSNREIVVDSGTIYFDIKYIGMENFGTKC